MEKHEHIAQMVQKINSMTRDNFVTVDRVAEDCYHLVIDKDLFKFDNTSTQCYLSGLCQGMMLGRLAALGGVDE